MQSFEDECLLMFFITCIHCRYWWLLVVPDSVHQAKVLSPKTWIVPESCLSTTSNSNESVYKEPVQDHEEKKLEQSSIVKQRNLSFKEKLLTTVVR